MRIPKMDLTTNDQIKKEQISDLRRKADQGDREAQFDLGLAYVLGWGVPQDYAIAGQWHEKAASQGEVDAQYSLGLLHYEGHGVPQDYVRARQWFEKAAAQGNARAMSFLRELNEDTGARTRAA